MKACELFHSFELNYFDFDRLEAGQITGYVFSTFKQKIRKLHNPVKNFDTFPENLREIIWFAINVLYVIEHRNGKNVVGINLFTEHREV